MKKIRAKKLTIIYPLLEILIQRLMKISCIYIMFINLLLILIQLS